MPFRDTLRLGALMVNINSHKGSKRHKEKFIIRYFTINLTRGVMLL